MSEKYQSLYVDFNKGKGRSTRSSQKSIFHNFFLIILILILLIGALGKIYFDRKTTKMRLEWGKINYELMVTAKEHENLQMEQEKFMDGDYILKWAKYKLNLRPSDPGQIRLMIKNQANRPLIVQSN